MNFNRTILLRVLPWLLLGLCSCDLHKKLGDLDYNQGVRDFDAGKFVDASNDFSRAIVQNPNHGDAYIYRGIVCHNAEDYAQAIKDYQRAIAIDPQNAVAYNNLGLSLEALGKIQEAITKYSEAISLDPNDVNGYISRASARGKLRDWDAALADFRDAEGLNQVPTSDLYQNRAFVQFMRDEFELAIMDATKAISLATNGDGVSLRIRGLARMHLRDYDSALSDLDMAVKLDPKDAESLAARGELKATKADLEGANLDFVKAIALEPTNLTAMAGLSLVKRRSGDTAGALASISKWCKYAPKSADAFLSLAAAQSDSMQYAQALKSFRTTVELDDKNYYARLWIWMIRTRLGERDEATKELSASLKAGEGDSEHEWELCLARYLTDELSETDLMAQAKDKAKRPEDVAGRLCEAHYYSGMKYLLAGNNPAAMERLKKCVADGQNDFTEYLSAKIELRRAGESDSR